jgi:hypothetical protein
VKKQFLIKVMFYLGLRTEKAAVVTLGMDSTNRVVTGQSSIFFGCFLLKARQTQRLKRQNKEKKVK